MDASEAEAIVVGFARGQQGVVTWRQIVRAGFGARWVRTRGGTGWLRRLHRGVYLVGPLEGRYSRFMAAVLAAGPGALLSHYPAAVVHEVRPRADGPIDVTVPGRKARSRPGIVVHHATLHPADITRRHGIPVTSAARTLLDLAATAPSHELDRALNEAHIHHRISTHSLNEQFSRYPHHRGTAALKKATRTEPKLTRSEAERLMLALIRDAGLPAPETNVNVAGHEVDMLWREHKLIVEIDGYAFHSMRRSFEQDRRRDQDLVAAGHRVTRVTWRQLTHDAIAVAVRLATALAA